MNANLSGEDYYLTLSYRKEKRPDRETLNRDIPNTFTKTAEDIRKHGKELKYIWTARRERGAAHLHIVVNGIDHITHHKRSMGKGMDLY